MLDVEKNLKYLIWQKEKRDNWKEIDNPLTEGADEVKEGCANPRGEKRDYDARVVYIIELMTL